MPSSRSHAAGVQLQPLDKPTLSANPSRVMCSSSARWPSATSASASHTLPRSTARRSRCCCCWSPAPLAVLPWLAGPPPAGAAGAGALAHSTHRFCRRRRHAARQAGAAWCSVSAGVHAAVSVCVWLPLSSMHGAGACGLIHRPQAGGARRAAPRRPDPRRFTQSSQQAPHSAWASSCDNAGAASLSAAAAARTASTAAAPRRARGGAAAAAPLASTPPAGSHRDATASRRRSSSGPGAAMATRVGWRAIAEARADFGGWRATAAARPDSGGGGR
jgi:hypothetical protein